MAGEMDNFNLFSISRSSKSTNKTNVLECRVCEDVFGLQGDKVPRLLYCGHTICHACLLRLPLNQDTVQCPFDRQPTPVGNSGVWGLKKNFALLELLERLQASSHRGATPAPSAETLDKQRQLSVSCDEHEAHVAVVFCCVCSTHLCEACEASTHGTRTLARHRRVPISEKPRARPECPAHPAHGAEFACLEEACRGEVMCFICKDYGRHKGHQHALVETEAERLRASVAATVLRTRKLMDDMTDTVRKLEAAVARLEGSDEQGAGQAARGRVRDYFARLREQLAQQESVAAATVDTYLRERLCSLRQLQEDLATSLTQVASTCLECEQAALLDDARVLAASRDIHSALGFIEKHQQHYQGLGAEDLQPDANIPITFTKDNRAHIGPNIVMRVLTLGLDGAGKTSILFKLKQDEFMTTIPTIGFNVETVEYKNVMLTVWDVGGQHKLRPLWKHYYFNTQAVVFVIDSSNRERLLEAQGELAKLVAEKELKDASLLILANKQDVDGCAGIEEMTSQLALHKLCCARSWHIQACDAVSGTGLSDALDWLSRQIVAAGVQEDF